MPDRSTATDRKHREETADGGYFAPLTQGSHLLLTTSRPKGAPVSTRVQGIAEGDRAYFRVGSRSSTARYLRRAGRDPVQVTACNALGLVSYGSPRYAAIRPLSGEEASRAAQLLDRKYPVKRRFGARPRHRTRVHYELAVP
jgi:PPOX class probable F420-dependent enzyme